MHEGKFLSTFIVIALTYSNPNQRQNAKLQLSILINAIFIARCSETFVIAIFFEYLTGLEARFRIFGGCNPFQTLEIKAVRSLGELPRACSRHTKPVQQTDFPNPNTPGHNFADTCEYAYTGVG